MSTLNKTVQLSEHGPSTMPKYTQVALSQNIDVDITATATNEGVKTRSSKRLCNYNKKKILSFSCMVAISVTIVISTAYGAYKTIQRGHHYNTIGNSYNIGLLCECFDVRVEEETECTTSNNGPGGGEPSTTCNTEYTKHYTVSLIDYYDHTACSEAQPENINYFFSETSRSSKLFCIEGEQIKCFTNNECDQLFVDEENSFHDKATGMYVAASFLCVIGCCCTCCIMGCFIVLIKSKNLIY
eukprot:214309_1